MRAKLQALAPAGVRRAGDVMLAIVCSAAVAACNGTVGSHGTGSGNTGSGSSTGTSGSTGGPGTAGATGTPGTAGATGVGSTTGGAGSGTPAGTGGSTGGSTFTPPTFACDTSARAPEGTLRRLTMTQYRNTIADLVGWASGSAANGKTIMTEIATPLAALPADRREAVPQDLHGSYRRLDQSLQQTHVDATYDVAVAVGAALTTTARLGTVVGACATDTNTSNDATCLDAFIKKFGARALRRPLTTDEVTFYTGAYGSSTAASAASYADLIGMFLTAPDLMYFVEHG